MNKRIILSAILTLALLPLLHAQNHATLLSVRPDADSLEGGNLTFPRVVLCNTGRDSMKNIGLEVLVVDKYDTVVAHLRDTIAAIPGGDTAELAFRSRYTVPDYTGSYRLKAVYGTDTIVSVAHCIYRPDTCDISMLSVRPQQDSSFGIVKPVVRYCGYRNRYTYAVNHWDYVYVCLYDSNNVRLGMVNYNDYLNYKDTTVIRFSKGIKVFNYTGRYRLVAYVSYHASKNMIRSNDTVSCTGYCIGDTIDIRMLSVQPSRDSAFGETKVTPVLNTYYRHPDLENSFVDVCVQMYDSSHVLLHQFKNEIFVNCNKTEKEVMSYVDWKVPDYTGVYYLKAFFVNVKKEENLSTANDTAFFKAHCIRHLKKDVALLSVRPQHDSAEVGTWTSPVVVVKNVGDLDVRNVAVEVQMDTTQLGHSYTGKYAYYWDTIPFLAAGDSVKWVMSARYQVPDCWAGSYYRMYASIAVENDEVSTNNNAFYEAKCSKTVDFRLISFQIPSDTLWGGVPVYPKVRIVNNSIVVTSYFEFRMEVSDSAGNMLQSWQESGISVPAGDTLDFQCTKSIQVPNYNGVFRLRAYFSYMPVEYRLTRSDTLVQHYRCFHNDTIDVSLTNLVYPVTSELLIGRTRVYPTVYVRSRSNVVHHNLAITAIVYDNVGALYDSITEIIPKLEAGTSVYRFNRCYKVPNAPGKYKLKVCLESLKGDLSVADNVVQGEFRSRVRPDTIDVALDTLLCPSVTETLLGNTEVRPQVRVVNRGNAEADSLVIDALVYDQSGALADSLMGMIVLLEEGTDTLYTFHSAYKVPNADGTYTLRLHVYAPYGDTCLENNVLQRKLRSRRNDSVDLQLMSVTLSDTGVLAGGAWVRPTVKVANLLRNADANNVKVYVEVLDSAGQMLKLMQDNLARVPMADTVELVFADSLQVPDYTGKFWVRAYVEAAMYETDRSNDTLFSFYSCQSSDAIPTVAMVNWQLGQNIPNPAADKTLVPVTLPMPGTVRLQVFAADGRLLYRSEHAVAEGKSLLPLDLAGYAAGVYYYSVEYKGERKVRKMVVE